MRTVIIKRDENASGNSMNWMERTLRKDFTKEVTVRLFFVSLLKEEELIRRKEENYHSRKDQRL